MVRCRRSLRGSGPGTRGRAEGQTSASTPSGGPTVACNSPDQLRTNKKFYLINSVFMIKETSEMRE